MRVTFIDLDGDEREVPTPPAEQGFVAVPGTACPNAKCRDRSLRVAGVRSTRATGRSTVREAAACIQCGARAGVLVVEVDTIFGIEEDRRVLAGPWRVY